jgi:hypothetical protein
LYTYDFRWCISICCSGHSNFTRVSMCVTRVRVRCSAVDDERQTIDAQAPYVCVYARSVEEAKEGKKRNEWWRTECNTTTTTTDESALRRRLVRSLSVGAARLYVCLFFLHHSAALATITGASRSCSFVLCLLLAFSCSRRETSVSTWCAQTRTFENSRSSRSLFCVDRVTIRVCLCEVNEYICNNSMRDRAKKRKNKKLYVYKKILRNNICTISDVHSFVESFS